MIITDAFPETAGCKGSSAGGMRVRRLPVGSDCTFGTEFSYVGVSLNQVSIFGLLL